MQNVGQSENRNIDKVNVQLDVVKSSTPQSSASSPAKSETETYSGAPAKYMTDSSESEDDSVSEILLACLCLSRPDLLAEMEEEGSGADSSKFLLSHDDPERAVDPEMQARLEALLEAAGIGKLSGDGKHLADPEVLRRLTSSVSCALDEAAAALTRMRSDQPPQHHHRHHQDKPTQCGTTATTTSGNGSAGTAAASGGAAVAASAAADGAPSLAEACSDGDVGTVRKLLTEGRSVHETTEEGESLLSLACSAGYYELAQVLLAMHASVEDRGIKGDCTPLMEAASAGHVDIVRLLVAHGADVNAVSGSGNTPLMYACAGGHEECVRALLDARANVEDHNENGHTPLMEAASAGHVGVAKILLEHGAGINTHSNEFKESALTLACYKGHLDMVRFLLAAGADREHKTDEMHTALMEASMDGHVEVARLLLDSGAQVNMPTDSFESPLTLAACGGHVELAMLLLERGANIEEVNDEGYTPLMEAAREGHEEMVALLLGQGAQINAQTEETQETALTLACCGGFLEVADFLIKAGADAELGASTPLMEASQEGHLELVRYLLNAGADVHAQTQTGDTALTYACENGHTDVADLLLRAGAQLEHESEGGRTPLMKACRAGHLCTVQFLVGKGADVNRMTANGDHTPLSLACAGGHADVVKFLLACDADPFRKLKDNSTMLIEAAKGGHTAVVQLLLDYPHSVMLPRDGVVTGAAEEPGSGLSAAQAAALGLAHAPAPTAPAARALLPAHQHPHQHQHPALPGHPLPAGHDLPANFAKLYLDGRKKQPTTAAPAGTTSGAPTCAPPLCAAPPGLTNVGLCGGPVPAPAPAPAAPLPVAKHKCARKQRPAPLNADHHLPPPPDILDEQICLDAMSKLSLPPGFTWKDVTKKRKNKDLTDHDFNRPEAQPAQRNEPLPETDRSLLDLTDSNGPPTLATSALHALDLQFCAQGVTTTIHLPTTPPYPPPQQLFPVQQLAANLNQLQPDCSQHQLQDLQAAQLQQLATQQKKPQHYAQQDATQRPQDAHVPLRGEDTGTSGAEARELCAVLAYLQREPGEDTSTSGAEARELGAVLAYLQREVPSLVALPPNELRSLVLQVMQQKSHEILSAKCEEAGEADGGGGEAEADERQARRLLAAAEEALATDWPREHHHHHLHHHHFDIQTGNTCQYRVRPTSPEGSARTAATVPPPGTGVPAVGADEAATVEGFALPQPPQPPLPPALHAHHHTPHPHAHAQHPPHPATYTEVYRSASFTAPPAGGGAAAATGAQPPQPHPKRDQHHHNASVAAKKKGRFGVARGRGAAATGAAGAASALMGTPPAPAPAAYCAMDVDGETDSNRDTALTLACAGGHEDLVELLLSRGADIEHRDKKGFTPLILAATAGHEKIVEILLNHGADIEAQSERTKDTPLSLACSGGRYEVVELILGRGANKEHRNVSDYTPLSLAASGGYVNIIRLLLHHQAEINSRTGSKLGISPLMLAAMNGHTAAVRLLLDCGSDINAQIETNRNTALTLACFQGRHEVVSLLLDRKANVEHRAKTGLTPLMEAASGGYVEVGRVLLDKGADVNAPPVPSSRDTALTIAADKGHTKFVELLLQRRAAVEVKNKKGNSPLWLAANGGHLAVVEMLYAANADIDSQDNRKVSCLMAAFRKGHTKVVKWMVGVVTQFPSDQEMTRYICTISDKELLEKCQECVRVIRAAKETQAARANQNATILLEELETERCRDEARRQAAARRRERKKKKKMEKKEERRKLQEENDKNSLYSDAALRDGDGDVDGDGDGDADSDAGEPDDEPQAKEEGDSGIDANSQGSCSSSDVKAPPASSAKSKKKKKEEKAAPPPPPPDKPAKQPDKNKSKIETKPEKESTPKPDKKEKENVAPSSPPATPAKPTAPRNERKEKKQEEDSTKSVTVQSVKYGTSSRKSQVFESSRLNVDKEDFEMADKYKKHGLHQWETEGKSISPKSGTAGGRRDEGWKEVVRKSSVQTLSTVEPGCKKVSVGSHAISRVIGRAGSNINAIRAATGAHIEVDKQTKGQGERIITIKGSGEATKQAASLIAAMIRDPEADIAALLPRSKLPAPATQPPPPPKPAKQPQPKVSSAVASSSSRAATRAPAKHAAASRAQPQRLLHAPSASEKRASLASTSAPATPLATPAKSLTATTALSYTGAIVGARPHTFAAKLTATPPLDAKPRVSVQVPATSPAPPAPAASPLKSAPPQPRESPPSREDEKRPLETAPSPDHAASWTDDVSPQPLHINTTPQSSASSSAGASTNASAGTGTNASAGAGAGSSGGAQEYSLFKDLSAGAGMWGAAGEPHHSVDVPPPQADLSKAPGYRGGNAAGGGCSPCSRASSHGSTPPPFAPQPQTSYHQPMPIGNNVNIDMSGLSRNGPTIYPDNPRNGHNMMGMGSGGGGLGLGYVGVEGVSRLNPRAPDFAAHRPQHQQHQQHQLLPNKHNAQQLFAGSSSGVGVSGGVSGGNLSTLLLSYQPNTAQQKHTPMQHTPPQHHPYQSLLDRGVGVGCVGGVGSVGGWGEEEERKPRPIGTERAWKLTNAEDWPLHQHHMHGHHQDHDRYQGMSGVSAHSSMNVGQPMDSGYGTSGGGAGANAGGAATAAALSLMHALPLHYMPPNAEPPHHWDRNHHHNPDKQTWSKWTH